VALPWTQVCTNPNRIQSPEVAATFGTSYKEMDNNMIEEVYKLALEKYAGDENQAKAFTAGFEKEAGIFSEVGSAVGGHILKGLGTGLGVGVVALGIHGISSLMAGTNNDALHATFQRALDKVYLENPLINSIDKSTVQSYGETIFKFAPHVSLDPNLLKTILSHAVHGEGVDPKTIQDLATLEKSFIESKKGAMFTPKLYV
jgi:hypothetical protein